jgi:hypothetical protein
MTGLLDLDGWPPGMRLIVRKERPHPAAQLRFTDIDGHRFTCLATDAKKGQLAGLKLRHRGRARREDRISSANDTGLRNLQVKGFAQNQVWCEIVALGLRAACLDPAARPDQEGPPLGTQAAPPCASSPSGSTRLQEPPATPAPRPELGLGRIHHRCDRPPLAIPPG